jgi:hypothetical protein
LDVKFICELILRFENTRPLAGRKPYNGYDKLFTQVSRMMTSQIMKIDIIIEKDPNILSSAIQIILSGRPCNKQK